MTLWNELPPEALQILTDLGRLTDELAGRKAVVKHQVDLARESGASWRMIGVALGVTAQAAWERYSGLERDSEIACTDPMLPMELADDLRRRINQR